MTSIADLIERERQHIAALDAAIAKLKRDQDLARVKIAAYQEALGIIQGEKPNKATAEASELRPSAHAGKRRISANWEKIFDELRELEGAQFTTDDALAAASRVGIETNRNAVRSNLANYVNVGLVERVSEGVFRLTPVNESGQ